MAEKKNTPLLSNVLSYSSALSMLWIMKTYPTLQKEQEQLFIELTRVRWSTHQQVLGVSC